MASDPNVALVIDLTQKITFYAPFFVISLGTIGCFCNFLTFSSVKLRKNSCSLYFLGASIFELLTLTIGMLTRFLADHFGYNLYQKSAIYCKLRQYLVNILPAIATCFIVLAAMDRFMSTSSKTVYRSFATIRCAKRIVPFCLTICVLSYVHYPFFSELRPTCSLQPGTYALFTVVFSIVWTSILPHLLMLWFGFGTQLHIRQTRRRIVAVNNQQRRIQRTEIQLVKMMLFQVGFSSVLISTRIAYFSYNVFTTNTIKDDYHRAIDTFFNQLTTQLFYLNYAKSFYVYTLFSKYFRRIFLEKITKIYYQVLRRLPVDVTNRRRNLNGQTPNTTPMVELQRKPKKTITDIT